MRAKTLVELMTLGASLYTISKDKEMVDKISSFISSGKKKIEDYINSVEETGDDEGEVRLVDKLILKAKEAEAEMEERLEILSEKMYKKLHIAHTAEIEKLQAQIDELKKKQ